MGAVVSYSPDLEETNGSIADPCNILKKKESIKEKPRQIDMSAARGDDTKKTRECSNLQQNEAPGRHRVTRHQNLG